MDLKIKRGFHQVFVLILAFLAFIPSFYNMMDRNYRSITFIIISIAFSILFIERLLWILRTPHAELRGNCIVLYYSHIFSVPKIVPIPELNSIDWENNWTGLFLVLKSINNSVIRFSIPKSKNLENQLVNFVDQIKQRPKE